MRACRLLLLFGLAWGACAQQISIELDPLKSKIEFALGGALHTVHGTFRLKKGRLTFDRRAGAISGQLIADAASGNSGNGLRDRRMHHDILQSDRYPEIVFEPVKFVGSVDSGVTVSGWLSLHGVRREITVPMQVRIPDSGLVASGTFSIPYLAWGLKNPSTFLLRVDDHVEITVTAVGAAVP